MVHAYPCIRLGLSREVCIVVPIQGWKLSFSILGVDVYIISLVLGPRRNGSERALVNISCRGSQHTHILERMHPIDVQVAHRPFIITVENADTSANSSGRKKPPPSRRLGPLAVSRMS